MKVAEDIKKWICEGSQ